MLSQFERKVAFRYLTSRGEEKLISIIAIFSLIGVALGVATLIVVLSVMNGVRSEMIKSIVGLEGHVTLYGKQTHIDSYDQLTKDLQQMAGVSSALPKLEGQVMLSYRGNTLGAMIAGFRAEDLDKKPLLKNTLSDSAQQALAAGEGIILGSRIMEKFGISIGDQVMLISPQGRATVMGLVPRIKSYTVAGSFSVGMFAYDNGLVLLPFEQAQRYLKLRDNGADAVTTVEINLDDAEQAPLIKANLAQRFPNYRIYDWKNSNSHLFQAVIVQRNVMFLILMLIIIVAAFNIVASLIMLVKEKTRDIAILRTMGASRASIKRIFITCGAMVGALGIIIGTGLGLLIAYNTESIQKSLEEMLGYKLFADELYFLSSLPSRVDLNEVFFVVGIAFVLCLIATLYPARKAANLEPVRGLAHD